MCIMNLDGDILGVQGWWLPRSGITKLDSVVYDEPESGRVEWSGLWEWLFVCLFVGVLLVVGVHMLCGCLQM